MTIEVSKSYGHVTLKVVAGSAAEGVAALDQEATEAGLLLSAEVAADKKKPGRKSAADKVAEQALEAARAAQTAGLPQTTAATPVQTSAPAVQTPPYQPQFQAPQFQAPQYPCAGHAPQYPGVGAQDPNPGNTVDSAWFRQPAGAPVAPPLAPPPGAAPQVTPAEHSIANSADENTTGWANYIEQEIEKARTALGDNVADGLLVSSVANFFGVQPIHPEDARRVLHKSASGALQQFTSFLQQRVAGGR